MASQRSNVAQRAWDVRQLVQLVRTKLSGFVPTASEVTEPLDSVREWKESLLSPYSSRSEDGGQRLATLLDWSESRSPLDTYRNYSDFGMPLNELAASIVRRARDFYSAFLRIRSLFIRADLSESSGRKLLDLYGFLTFCETIVDVLKQFTNVAFCQILGQRQYPEPLSIEQDGVIRTVRVDRWVVDLSFYRRIVQSSLRPRSRESIFFANTIFQGWKKGMLPTTVATTIKSLKKQRDGLGGRSPHLTEKKRRLIDRLVNLVHGTHTWRAESREAVEVIADRISSKATIAYSSRLQGNLGYLTENWFLEKYPDSVPDLLDFREDSPAIEIRRALLQTAPERETVVVETISETAGFAVVTATVERCRYWSSNPELLKGAQDHLTRYNDEDGDREAVVTPQFVSEPFKQRGISLPASGDYARLMALQKLLWRVLQDPVFEGTFALTSRTINSDLMNEWHDRARAFSDRMTLGSDVFVSGDYQGATDSVAGELSEYLLRKLLDPLFRFNPELVLWAVKSMTASVVAISGGVDNPSTGRDRQRSVQPPTADPLTGCSAQRWFELTGRRDGYAKWFAAECRRAGVVLDDDRNPNRYRQTNGQLMGHVLSFPILCLLNLACYHDSWEIAVYGSARAAARSDGLHLVNGVPPVLINGDDIGFWTDQGQYEVWRDNLCRWGFVMSVGKNFVSSDFIQLNSTLFSLQLPHVSWVDETRSNFSAIPRPALPERRLEEIGFVNFGLLTGRGKARDGGDVRNYSSVREILALITEYEEGVRGTNPGSVLGEAEALGISPFAAMIRSLPDLFSKQFYCLPDRVRERWCPLALGQLASLREALPWLPWVELFRSLGQNDGLFAVWREFFRNFGRSRMPDYALLTPHSTMWKVFLEPEPALRTWRRDVKASKRSCARLRKQDPVLWAELLRFSPTETSTVFRTSREYRW